MATDTFGRHTRTCVDAATHCAFAALAHHPRHHQLFARLVRVAHARSDLMTTPPTRRGEVVQVAALHNMLAFEGALVRDPDDWPGATGHPLRVIDSFASHVFGRYPTPRFLASAWFGGNTTDRVDRRRGSSRTPRASVFAASRCRSR
ncbi:MAG: PcfJ-like protein [Myxococcales bacterium]|nr:PcfJ-like protein [Myxococcales bacterium]